MNNTPNPLPVRELPELGRPDLITQLGRTGYSQSRVEAYGQQCYDAALKAGREDDVPAAVIQRLRDAIDGECDGLGITQEAAESILRYIGFHPQGRIIGGRDIDGVWVVEATSHSELMPPQLLVRYEDYLKATATDTPRQEQGEEGCANPYHYEAPESSVAAGALKDLIGRLYSSAERGAPVRAMAVADSLREILAALSAAKPQDSALADTQRAIIEAAEERGYRRGVEEAKQQGPGEAVIVGYDPGQDDREAEDYHVIMAMGRLLAAIAISVKGPEPAGTAWSYHDLPDIVAALQEAAEQVADEMTAWAATKMADRGSSRRDRLMISEWAKRLRNPEIFPVKDFEVEGTTLTKEEMRAIVRKVIASSPQVEAKRQTGEGEWRRPGIMDIESDRVVFVDRHDDVCSDGFRNVWIAAAAKPSGEVES